MNNMKCPKCGGRLVYWGATGALLKCSQCGFGWGNEELWQALIQSQKDLLAVKKALKRAIESLKAAELVCVLEGHKFTAQAIQADVNEIKKALKKPKRKDK